MRGVLTVTALLLTATPALAVQVTSVTDLLAYGASASAPKEPEASKMPCRVVSAIDVDGVSYQFGSGGYGCSIPAGDHLITPEDVGKWGARHGALGIDHDEMWDGRLGRNRDGILIHADLNGSMKTEGCVAVKKFNEFKAKVLAMIAEFGRAFLHIDAKGSWLAPFASPVVVHEAKVDIGEVKVREGRRHLRSARRQYHSHRHYAHHHRTRYARA